MDELLENFKKKFELPNNGYSNSKDLIDNKVVGFSVFKEQEQLQREGFKSLFHIYIKRDELNNKEDKKAIVITAVYGKITKEGLVTYSSDDPKKGLKWPVGLFSEGEFFYNIKTSDLFYRDDAISGVQLLNKINDLHLKSSKPMKGAWFRIKLLFFIILAKFFKLVFYIVSGVQYLFSNIKVNFYLFMSDSINPGIKSGKVLKIFDYEVEARIGVIYAFVHLTVYSLLFFYNFKPLFIITIFKNPFLTIMYVIISLGLTDAILSKFPPNYFTNGILIFLRNNYIKTVSKKIKI